MYQGHTFVKIRESIRVIRGLVSVTTERFYLPGSV
jgi:hypothetical protein